MVWNRTAMFTDSRGARYLYIAVYIICKVTNIPEKN